MRVDWLATATGIERLRAPLAIGGTGAGCDSWRIFAHGSTGRVKVLKATRDCGLRKAQTVRGASAGGGAMQQRSLGTGHGLWGPNDVLLPDYSQWQTGQLTWASSEML
ncbi:unnamed protein product [Ostreobium quekettii]|uniref:Uncharacterized protein n=1 Tax=Ostreobium quekettii TaxID=121088 RepID=A0A8S1IYE6_9CHLO|nr:unnamed protein product [Ostreobium quekettii]